MSAVLLMASAVTPALAVTIAQKQAEAASAQTALTALQTKAETASEAFNQARDQYDAVTAKVNVAAAQVRTLDAKTNVLQTALGNRADAMYRSDGTLGVLEELLSAHSIEDFNSTIELLTRISEQDAATVAQLKVARVQAAAAHQALATQQAAALVVRNNMSAKKVAAAQAQAAGAQLLAGLNADIKKMLAAQAAAEARAAANAWNSLHHGGGFIDPGGNPPSSSKGALAVWWAEKALGCWYQWAAAGPNVFDCSGLTMWAYGHAGISLPHYSGAQINVGARVGVANLEPGDLVFFGHPIHHVGMYVGHGDFIEAPYTGVRVRISSLAGRMGDYAGACRPGA